MTIDLVPKWPFLTFILAYTLQAQQPIQLFSPSNHSTSRQSDTEPATQPSIIVLHYTAEKLDKTLAIFLGYREVTVAPHYTISESGIVFQHVPEELAAFHAGVSSWRNIVGINKASIGIEHVNEGYKVNNEQPTGVTVNGSLLEWYPFEEKQITASMQLCTNLIHKYGIEPRNIVGHSDVAPGRKSDPGPLFPWHIFAQAGIGAWPQSLSHHKLPCLEHAYQTNNLENWIITHLHIWGYTLPSDKCSSQNIIKAFQMHFRPASISGTIDDETLCVLNALFCEYITNNSPCPCGNPR